MPTNSGSASGPLIIGQPEERMGEKSTSRNHFMQTIFKSPVGFFSADTDKSIKQVPKGKLWIHTVQFTTYELDSSEDAMDNVQFTIAMALPEDMVKDNIQHATLLKRLMLQFAEHVRTNS